MNLLFRIFITLGGLVVVALFAALIAPFWIDWEKFTDEFETQATRVIGQPVRVGGEANLRLLPLPYISFEDLEVGRNADGSPLMTVEKFSLKAELFPFLSGKVQIVAMSMLKPQLDLRVEENGTIAWTNPSEQIVDPGQVKIEQLTIEDGTVVVSGLAGGRAIKIEKLEARVEAQSVLGPWRIEGQGDVSGAPMAFSVSTGSYQQNDKSLRVRIEARKESEPYALSINGPVKILNDVLAWSGDFALTPFSKATWQTMRNPKEPFPVQLEGGFSATPERVVVPEFRLEIGRRDDPYVVSGSGQAEIREKVFFNIEADGRQIDLDWMAATGDGEQRQTVTLETRLEALRAILDRIPVPVAEGEIDLMLPAIVAGDTYIREVKAVVRPRPRGWELRSLIALLPGDTRLEAAGRVGLREDFGFTGRLLLASRQPSGFADWIAGDVPPEIRRLSVAGLDADVTLSLNQALFENLELRLDDALLSGKLQRIGAAGGKPALIAELSGNRIITQDLRALYSLVRGRDANDLSGHDLNVRISTDRLQARIAGRDVEMGDVEAHIQMRNGGVSFENFKAGDLFGAAVVSQGRIENVLTKPNGHAKLTIDAADGQRILALLNDISGGQAVFRPFLAAADLTSEFHLEMELDATSHDDATRGLTLLNGQIGGTAFAGQVSFNGNMDDPVNLPVEGNVQLENELPSTLLRQLGLETRPAVFEQELNGPLSLVVSVNGELGGELSSQIAFVTPDLNLSLTGRVQVLGPQAPAFDLNATIGTSDVLPWMRLTDFPVPIRGETALPVSARFAIKHASGVTEATGIDGQIAGNRFAGDLKLQESGLARPRLTGSISADELSLLTLADLSFGRYANFDLVGGVLPEEEINFGAPLYAGFDANVDLMTKRTRLAGLLEGTEGEALLVMIDGAVDLQDVRFTAMGGTLSGAASFKNTDGTTLANGRFLLENASSSALASALGLKVDISGKFQASASLESSGRSISGLVQNLSGNGFVRTSEGRIGGLDPAGFDTILLKTRADDYEPVPEETIQLVERTVLAGDIDVEMIEMPFSIIRGDIKFRNVTLKQDKGTLVGNVEVDILTGDTQADLSVSFNPPKRDKISGTDPAVRIDWQGVPGSMERSIDTSLLEGYLSLRAFEMSQRRVETMEARIIEKQRHLREIEFAFALERFVERKEEEARRATEEIERLRIEEEEHKRAQQAAEQAEQLKLKEESLAKAESEAALQKATGQTNTPATQPPVSEPDTSGIRGEPLAPLNDKSQSEGTASDPMLRKNILRNVEDFLTGD